MVRQDGVGEREPAAGAVLGLDNIALTLPVAGIGTRVLAVAIDYIVLSAVTLLAVLVLVFLSAISSGGDEPSGWFFVLLAAGGFALQWGYFAIAEIATQGRTPGKWAVGLRTVGREGGTPSTFAFLLRNLVRALDVVFGLPLMALDPNARRLGDRIAGTLVILERKAKSEIVLGRVPPSWGAKEVALVESYLRRERELSPQIAARVGERLVALLAAEVPEWLEGAPAGSGPAWKLRHALEAHEEVR